MGVTTIKVDAEVRDRLAAVAGARGVTMGALLESESRRLQTEQYWADVERAQERLRLDDPDGWTEYLQDLDDWRSATGPDPGDAADEWPEFRGDGPR